MSWVPGVLHAFVLVPLVAGQPRFFDGTRFPSDRRPVRVANLQLALDQFAQAGLPLQVRLVQRIAAPSSMQCCTD